MRFSEAIRREYGTAAKLRQDEQDFSGLRGKEEDKSYLPILINPVNPV
jgi:hypothetical protein